MIRGSNHSEETKAKIRARRFANPLVGSKNPNWRGGRVPHVDGYIWVLDKDHPKSDGRGYVLEHRLVMERHIGRFLNDGEVVHHLNGDRGDNRIENLELYASNKEHMVEESSTIPRDETTGRFLRKPL